MLPNGRIFAGLQEGGNSQFCRSILINWLIRPVCRVGEHVGPVASHLAVVAVFAGVRKRGRQEEKRRARSNAARNEGTSGTSCDGRPAATGLGLALTRLEQIVIDADRIHAAVGAADESELVNHQAHRRVGRDRDCPAALVVGLSANLLARINYGGSDAGRVARAS